MGNIILPDSAVLAFGGNALKGNGDNPESRTIESQEKAIEKAAIIVGEVRKLLKKILVIHGNGPQVGWMLKRVNIASRKPHKMHNVPLANLVANTQGAIGISLARKIAETTPALTGEVAQIGTQIIVDKHDPAFKSPTKLIGNFMTKKEAKRREKIDGWAIRKCKEDNPKKPYRRVVASPEPLEIVEIDILKKLIEQEIITICCGGGGIPSTLENGRLKWIDAVIDKDKAAALAAIMLEIKLLAIFTVEDGIYLPKDFRKKHNGDNATKPIPQISTKELKEMLPDLPSGSMKPKAESLIKFADETQNQAWIGPLKEGHKALAEGEGTRIIPS